MTKARTISDSRANARRMDNASCLAKAHGSARSMSHNQCDAPVSSSQPDARCAESCLLVSQPLRAPFPPLRSPFPCPPTMSTPFWACLSSPLLGAPLRLRPPPCQDESGHPVRGRWEQAPMQVAVHGGPMVKHCLRDGSSWRQVPPHARMCEGNVGLEWHR